MKRIPALVVATSPFAAVPGAAAQTSSVHPEPAPAMMPGSLDLPQASYAVVDRPLLAEAEQASLTRIPMPRAARDGAIGGAVAGVVVGGAFGYFLGYACDTGACGTPRQGLFEGAAVGAVAGAVVGYVAGLVWDAARDDPWSRTEGGAVSRATPRATVVVAP